MYEEESKVPQKINVLICEPLTAPYMKEIDSELKSLQATVGGGLIQAIYPFEDEVALVCNEEGKINGMTLNRAVYGDEGEMLDIIAGTFFIAGLDEDKFGSLTPELAEKYSTLFKYPEIFVREGEEIKAIPVKPSVRDNLKAKTAEIKKETQDKSHNKSEHEIWVGQKSGNTNGVSLLAAMADGVTTFFAENVKWIVSKVFVQ